MQKKNNFEWVKIIVWIVVILICGRLIAMIPSMLFRILCVLLFAATISLIWTVNTK